MALLPLGRVKFKCLEGCGFCCHYKVDLSNEDIKRLSKIRHMNKFLEKTHLKKRNNWCIFLDKTRCSVYSARPLWCRTYPFIPESYLQPEMDLDLSCPGIGFGEEVDESYLRKILHKTEPNKVSAQIEDLLRQKGGHVNEELCSHIVGRLLEETFKKESLEEGIALIRDRLKTAEGFSPFMGNLTKLSEVEPLLEGVSTEPLSFPSTGESLKEEFSHSFMNTKLEGEEVHIYKAKVNSSEFVFSGGQKVSLSEIGTPKISPEARRELGRYLRVWTSRGLPFRLAHFSALYNFHPQNTLFFYLKFMLKVLTRTYILAKIISIRDRVDRVEIPQLKEAIRGSDNILRGKCRIKFN